MNIFFILKFINVVFTNLSSQCYLNLQKIYNLLKDLNSGRNRLSMPNFFGKTTSAGIELYIMGTQNVDDEKMERSLEIYFRQVIFYSFVNTIVYKEFE